jgi:uncharacterized RDD family membrane protein YckC
MNERGSAALGRPSSGAEPDLVVDSATGVDVSLPIAGPGARAYAFVVDWHIRTILFIAWYVVGALIYNGSWSLVPPIEPSAGWFGLVVLPGAAIYFLYHWVLEIAMHGRTPGKRVAGVRIVTRDGALPAVAAHLTRNVFRLVDSFPLFYGIGLTTAVVTKDHVRIGDLAAGTLLVYDRGDESVLEHVSAAALGSRLDAHTAEIVNELLARWQTLDVDARVRLARTLLTKVHGAQLDTAALDELALREHLERLARGAA